MTHDYIIVGAGSAGCVLANRLTEDGTKQVLLLEAGQPDNKLEVRVPAAFSKMYKTEVDWNYATVPQPQLNGRQIYTPRGKMLGGSSSINAMIVQRGHPGVYDGWAQMGNETWGWADVLPYFKKLEHNERFDDEMHGQGGPLNVADPRTPSQITHRFVEAAAQVGYPQRVDFNDGEQVGFGIFQLSQKNGQRHSAATAYLVPAMKRDNLRVETGAQATRLLFEGTRCVGLEYVQDGQLQTARAAEVILCGGAINSPQLLMLSGVGPAEHLHALGIDVVSDVPGVGQNLIDHLSMLVGYHSKQPITLKNAESLLNLGKYLLLKRGMLTSNVAEAGGFLKLRDDAPVPDLQFHYGPTHFVNHGFDNPEGHGISLGPTLVCPKSRGEIKLQSKDPFDAPLIDPRYLSEPEDLEVLVEGVKIARQIAQAPALAAYMGEEYIPGAARQTDEELREAVRQHVETIYHPVGTCKMGHDSLAVVGEDLSVHTVSGLRVVDASVMPSIVNANTNIPTMMIAEKAADTIRGRR